MKTYTPEEALSAIVRTNDMVANIIGETLTAIGRCSQVFDRFAESGNAPPLAVDMRSKLAEMDNDLKRCAIPLFSRRELAGVGDVDDLCTAFCYGSALTQSANVVTAVLKEWAMLSAVVSMSNAALSAKLLAIVDEHNESTGQMAEEFGIDELDADGLNDAILSLLPDLVQS